MVFGTQCHSVWPSGFFAHVVVTIRFLQMSEPRNIWTVRLLRAVFASGRACGGLRELGDDWTSYNADAQRKLLKWRLSCSLSWELLTQMSFQSFLVKFVMVCIMVCIMASIFIPEKKRLSPTSPQKGSIKKQERQRDAIKSLKGAFSGGGGGSKGPVSLASQTLQGKLLSWPSAASRACEGGLGGLRELSEELMELLDDVWVMFLSFSIWDRLDVHQNGRGRKW